MEPFAKGSLTRTLYSCDSVSQWSWWFFARNWNFLPVSCKNWTKICTKLEKNSSFVQNGVMDKNFKSFILSWKKTYIQDVDLALFFQGDTSRRYDAVKYAVRQGVLIPLRRGVYLIASPYKKLQYDPFEIAQVLYGPSYISLESALSHHNWIPESVFTTTSVTSRRTQMLQTPIGVFRYSHTPEHNFYLNVFRVEDSTAVFLLPNLGKRLLMQSIVIKRNGNLFMTLL